MAQAPDRSARHIVTGAEYVEQLNALESDRRARAGFRDLVLNIVRPGATLFDFGCGTGLDACFYAERGFTVRAYDVDQAMCEFFAAHCRNMIEAGHVKLQSGTYRDFLTCNRVASGEDGVDLVTANFAPLNLIDNLSELFASFHALTAPKGKVLASVLSPYFLGDLQYRWWWRNLPRLLRDGRYSVAGAQAPIIRRRPADFAAQCAPYFILESVFRGLPRRRLQVGRGIEQTGRSRATSLGLSTCRFMFLLFARREVKDDSQ
jgi:SAM-dependent methyltransferase